MLDGRINIGINKIKGHRGDNNGWEGTDRKQIFDKPIG